MFKTIFQKSLNITKNNYKQLTTVTKLKNEPKYETQKISAWQIHSYGEIDELQSTTIRAPFIQSPNQLLIEVEAASVNPIDLLMISGYGRTLFQIPRSFEMDLPLTLGRDFCGTVINKGLDVKDSFSIGDKVYGFIPIHKQGSFQQLILADTCHVCKKPEHLNAVESSSLVYATMTAWSSLYVMGNLICKNPKNLRILILGASGGVGTAAIQLLKSQEAFVFGTCATDAVPLVQSLGADCVFDYTDKDYIQNVAMEGYYHIILDCAKFGYNNLPKTWKFGTYITLNSPLLYNTDKYGLIGGLFTSANDFICNNLQTLGTNQKMMWGFFLPSSDGLKFINKLITKGQINPVVHQEFTFDQLPEAMKTLSKGHLRGKIVVKF